MRVSDKEKLSDQLLQQSLGGGPPDIADKLHADSYRHHNSELSAKLKLTGDAALVAMSEEGPSAISSELIELLENHGFDPLEAIDRYPKSGRIRGLNLKKKSISTLCDEDMEIILKAGDFQHLSLEGQKHLTSQGLAKIAKLSKLQHLYLSSTRMDDEALCGLTSLSELKTLHLSNTNVTDEGVRHLSKSGALLDLDLSQTEVTDKGVVALANLEKLQRLSLADTDITGDTIAKLSSMKSLQSLNLKDTPVTDSGMDEIAKLSGLTELNLQGTQITDRGASKLPDLKYLQRLSLCQAKITDLSTESIANLKGLQELDLSYTGISDRGLADLKDMKSLKALHLQGTAITDEGLAQLKEMKSLRMLDLSSTGVSATALRDLRDALPHCKITGNPQWDVTDPPHDTPWLLDLRMGCRDSDLAKLGKHTALTELILSGTPITDTGVAHLRNLRQLQILHLDNTKITDQTLETVRHFKGLQTLVLSDTAISNDGIEKLAELKALRHLNLSGVTITDEGLNHLKKMKGLRELDLTNNLSISSSKLDELRRALPHCLIRTASEDLLKKNNPDTVQEEVLPAHIGEHRKTFKVPVHHWTDGDFSPDEGLKVLQGLKAQLESGKGLENARLGYSLQDGTRIPVKFPSREELMAASPDDLVKQWTDNQAVLASLVAQNQRRIPYLGFSGACKQKAEYLLENASIGDGVPVWAITTAGKPTSPVQQLTSLGQAAAYAETHTRHGDVDGKRLVDRPIRGPILVLADHEDMGFEKQNGGGAGALWQKCDNLSRIVGNINAKNAPRIAGLIPPELTARFDIDGLPESHWELAISLRSQVLVLEALKLAGVIK